MASIGIDIDPDGVNAFPAGTVPNLTLLCTDAIDWLAAHNDTPDDTLIYLDPPYLMETRSWQRPLYRFELATPEDHELLLDVITSLHCMVMISGYYSELYAQRLAGWRTVQFLAVTRSGAVATEWVWLNFPPPLELHDYRYLGRDFRERERIRRKQARWRNRLDKMPDLERYAMLSTIAELREGALPGGLAEFDDTDVINDDAGDALAAPDIAIPDPNAIHDVAALQLEMAMPAVGGQS
jgi:hypothetical protein